MAQQQRYHVLERIDAGGMAEVFKAHVASIKGYEKLVAIKRILPDLKKNERFVRMFLDEAKVSLLLSHTNCVQVFDLGQADRTYFIVMEYVDGVDLKFVIQKFRESRQKMKVEHATYIAIEICKGLAHAHEKRDQNGNHLGIVHRDVSPPNVLISREGEVKLTDFGLAKAKGQIEQTDPGVVKGKFGYLSPEAAFGQDVDHRTDIFALGILIWEMLTSERLFRGKTDLETLQQVRTNIYRPLSEFRNDIPPALEKTIAKMLANKDQRYENVRGVVKDLSAFLFAYGIPVTSFDIAAMTARIGARRKTMASPKDRAIEAEVQQAVNRIVSLEEVDDLDAHLAEVYGDLPDAGQDIHTTGAFEDPRLWSDVGFDDLSVRQQSEVSETNDSGVVPGSVPKSGEWTKRNLNELVRKRVTYPGGQPQADMAVKPVQQEMDPTIQMKRPDAYQNAVPKSYPQTKPEQFGAMQFKAGQAPPQMMSRGMNAEGSPSLETGLPASMQPTPSVSLPRGRKKETTLTTKESTGLPLGLIAAIFILILSVLGVLYVLFFR